MRANKRAIFKRGGAACAAAAVLIGGTFAASAATAAPSAEATPASVATPSATETAMPNGLAEAVERDLGKSLEQFNAEATLAAKAADVQAEVTKADPAAVVSVAGDTINVKTSATAAAKTAAGTAKVKVTTIEATPLAAKVDAAGVDALFAAYTAEFGLQNLQAIMVNGNGAYVIRTGDAATGVQTPAARSFTVPAQPSVADFASKYANVVVEAAAGPATAFATDVTNGQGYAATSGSDLSACSIGWNGFDAAGKPAVISAGHCADDGVATTTELTDPTTEPAEGGVGGDIVAPLGVFGASQFGGPNNTPATAPSGWDGNNNNLNNIGTDVSVIDSIDQDLNQLAKVTDWTTPAAPKNSGPLVTGVSSAINGTNICKSGRTTGWSCGTVTETGVFLVGGHNLATNPDDIRAVRGFGSTNLLGAQGDSGGAIIAGSLAVGMISAGDPGVITYGVDLKDALAHTAGYSVKIFLEAPTVSTSTPVYRKGAVTGTAPNAPSGSIVLVTIDGVGTEAVVGGDGKWSVAAPNKFGTFTVTAQTKNGFSTSVSTKETIEVIKETLPAPAITTPANKGTVAAPVTTVSGTGNAGATVALSGDVEGTVVVGTDGKWSFTVGQPLGVGSYTVTAKQSLTDWNDSVTATNKFNVVPAAPAVTSPTNGQEFIFDQGPSAISGTNAAGATVTVTINGKSYDAVVVDGTWSVALGGRLATADYTVSAVQRVDGIDSVTANSTFNVLAAPAPPATQEPTPAPTTPAPAATQNPTPAPTQAPVENDLANTGISSTVLAFGAAAAVLILGGAAFLLFRRRSAN
ncbi:S1 family peptidase [Arthrobacter alpinus]|nr:S1 family peptidase [Arthrobacter alpinus]